MQITCVVGLPGSGKTCYVLHTYKQHAFFLDDAVDIPTQLGWFQANKQRFNHLFIADPYFCIPQVREQAEQKLINYFGMQPNWIFFENDPEACMQNVTRRDDGRKVRGLIHALKSRYHIPTGATVLPVWRPPE